MSLRPSHPYYLANEAVAANTALAVTDKFTGEVATRVALADAKTVELGIAAAVDATEPMRSLAAFERRAVLDHCVKRFSERAEELAFALCVEAGKPIKDSRGEVARLIDTFAIAAEESVRFGGEVLPLDRTPRGVGYLGMTKRVPIGPCTFISPFNFPLNLAAHKIAPAIAVGCPFVLKPASATPVGALLIGEVLAETKLPRGAFSILPCKAVDASALIEDERIKLLSFTGSAEVGWALKKRAGKKKVALELGGNAGCIVDETADLDDAVGRIVFGAFYQSGQSCVSVQRIFAHASIYETLRAMLVAATKQLKSGDPKLEDTFIGPLITVGDAERLERWIGAAKARGARVLCGGTRRGAILDATLVENVPSDDALCREEAFGPIAVLAKFDDFDEALARVDDSSFGLQAGVFTRDIHRAQRAWNRLEVGAVLIGEVPSWRADAMPYGGVKDSGQGREGLRWSMDEMSEVRLLVVRTPPK